MPGAASVASLQQASDATPNFTGYWRLLRTEGFDEFCRELGFPWVVRKAALRFMGGGSSADVIAHSGTTLTVTSLNPKGSWTRTYDTARETTQAIAEGTRCKTTAWWEGRVFHCRMEPPPDASFGVMESQRFMQGDFQVVQTVVKLRKGIEASMYWYFDRMSVLQQHLARRGTGSLLRQIAQDQARVQQATLADSAYLRNLLLDWQRWRSPADDYVPVMSPSYAARSSRLRTRAASPTSTPRGTMSKVPSDADLSALPAGIEVRSDITTRSIPKSDSRSRLASEGGAADARSMARSDSRSRLAGVDTSTGGLPESNGVPMLSSVAAAAAGAEAVPRVHTHAAQWDTPAFGSAVGGTDSPRDIKLAPLDRPAVTSRPAQQQQQQQQQAAELSFQRPSASTSVAGTATSVGGGAETALLGRHVQLEPISSIAAQRGSVPASVADVSAGPSHARAASVESLGASSRLARHHVKSFSADSRDGRGFSDGRSSPAPWSGRSSPSHRAAGGGALSGQEQALALKLQGYLDGRSISSVVPVATPNDTPEPQLLRMSPEQAEETAAKLRELESDMLLRRQDSRHGVVCCGLVISRQKNSLPEHLRVWEMSL